MYRGIVCTVCAYVCVCVCVSEVQKWSGAVK